MKIKTLLLLLFLTQGLFAQAQSNTSSATDNIDIITFDKNYFSPYRKPRDMSVAFRIGQVMPQGDFALPPSLDKEIEASFLGQDGFGAQPGISLAADIFLTLNPKAKSVWIKIPFSFHGLLKGHTFDWSPISSSITVEPLRYFGVGTGLMFNISFSNKFAVSAYSKISYMNLNSLPEINHRSGPYRFRVYNGESEVTDFMMTTGFDLQILRNISVFFEFNKMFIEQEYSYVEIYEGQWGSNVNNAVDFNSVIPYRSLTIGLAYIINRK